VAAALALVLLGLTKQELDQIPTEAELIAGAHGLPTFNEDLFAGSGRCTLCHETNGDALLDDHGNDVSPTSNWSSTMMANAFRDPLFQAKIETEIARHPQLQAVIEDECLTCHAPMARTEALYDGAEMYSLAEARESNLAQDGVSCTLCHQIQPANLGTLASFSGHYEIHDTRDIFGPYDDVDPTTMQQAVNYTPQFGEHMLGSTLCATCHTLFTPFIDDEGMVGGEFPEQVPYFEWLNSVYASGPEAQSCQECHMPILDEAIQISTRPSDVPERSPFFQHHFVGGNAFMVRLIRDNAEDLGARAQFNDFTKTIERTVIQLQTQTASVEFVEVIETDPIEAIVEVSNHSGHKFPTGYPARRAWLRVRAIDALDEVIFDSGAWTASGEVVGIDAEYEPHHDVISAPGEVQIYEMVAGDVNGEPTLTLLRMAQALKDNRLPPRGYTSSGPSTEVTAIAGLASSDPNFNIAGATEGSGTDRVTYMIPFGGAPTPIRLEAYLVYQSVPPRFAADLFTEDLPAVQTFRAMYEAADNTPIPVAVALWPPPAPIAVTGLILE
jgi:hypothetical protein